VPGGERDRLVQVGDLDDVDARDVLLGLDERPVAEQDFVALDAHGGGVGGGP
jgi:hypothetical protein